MRDIRGRTFEFSLRIIKLCQQLEEAGGVGRTLGWQLLRSGTLDGWGIQWTVPKTLTFFLLTFSFSFL